MIKGIFFDETDIGLFREAVSAMLGLLDFAIPWLEPGFQASQKAACRICYQAVSQCHNVFNFRTQEHMSWSAAGSAGRAQ